MAHTCDRQLKLDDCYEFEASLGYTVSSSAAWATERDTISTKTKQIKRGAEGRRIQQSEGHRSQRSAGARQKGGGAERKLPVDTPDTASFEDGGGSTSRGQRPLEAPEG